jgi:hypothetical protein
MVFYHIFALKSREKSNFLPVFANKIGLTDSAANPEFLIDG